MSVVTWSGSATTGAGVVRERCAATSYAPVFVLRGHSASINGVSLFTPSEELADGGSDGDGSQLFTTPTAVSCDSAGDVWLWDLALRAPLLHFNPLVVAKSIKARRLAKQVGEYMAEAARTAGVATPEATAAEAAARSREWADEDLRPLPNAAMGGVLTAAVIEVTVPILESGVGTDNAYDTMQLPLLVTQCRNQKVYFWALDDGFTEEEDGNDDEGGGEGGTTAHHSFTEAIPMGRGGRTCGIRLVHEVKVGQLGFCNALLWVSARPEGLDGLGGMTAAGQDGCHSITVASPEDNNGRFTFHRFHLDYDADADAFVAAVESEVSLPVADFKCGQAMAVSLCYTTPAIDEGGIAVGITVGDCGVMKGNATSEEPSPCIVVGYESGHVVVYNTVRSAPMCVTRPFPDPVTSVRVVPTAAATDGSAAGATALGPAFELLVGSAEGTLHAIHASPTHHHYANAISATPTVRWSYKSPGGLGSIGVAKRALGTLAVVGGWDGQVRLLDVGSGTMITNLGHHEGSVSTVGMLQAAGADETHTASFAFALQSNLSAGERRRRVGSCVFATAGADKTIAMWLVEW